MTEKILRDMATWLTIDQRGHKFGHVVFQSYIVAILRVVVDDDDVVDDHVNNLEPRCTQLPFEPEATACAQYERYDADAPHIATLIISPAQNLQLLQLLRNRYNGITVEL